MTAREKSMVEMHGELCSKRRVMRMLHIGYAKLEQLIDEGLIMTRLGGSCMDVRSVAQYIETNGTQKSRQRVQDASGSRERSQLILTQIRREVKP